MVINRMWAALSSRWRLKALSSARPEVSRSISHRPMGSASTQKNQITKPPRTAPQLLPDPPTMTITQIVKVNRSG